MQFIDPAKTFSWWRPNLTVAITYLQLALAKA
jgi:hypothetical protein